MGGSLHPPNSDTLPIVHLIFLKTVYVLCTYVLLTSHRFHRPVFRQDEDSVGNGWRENGASFCISVSSARKYQLLACMPQVFTRGKCKKGRTSKRSCTAVSTRWVYTSDPQSCLTFLVVCFLFFFTAIVIYLGSFLFFLSLNGMASS